MFDVVSNLIALLLLSVVLVLIDLDLDIKLAVNELVDVGNLAIDTNRKTELLHFLASNLNSLLVWIYEVVVVEDKPTMALH